MADSRLRPAGAVYGARAAGMAPRASWGAGRARRRALVGVVSACAVLGALFFNAAAFAAGLETPENVKVTAVTATMAHVSGVLNPKASGGVEGGFWGFQYGVSEPASCGAERILPEPYPGTGIAAGLPKEVVEETLTGLQPHAKYTVCLLELNTAQTEQPESVPVPFETLPEKPTVESVSTSSITPFAARLEAAVNPNNEPTTGCRFEYGETTSYGEELPCEPASLEGFGGQGVGANVSGLASATKYDYRVLVENATGESESAGEFTTATAEAPIVEAESTQTIGFTDAFVAGQVNPNYQAATYTFEYATKATGETLEGAIVKVPGGSLPAGSVGQPVGPVDLSGALSPATTYFYRVVASNAAGAKDGKVETFTTLTPTAPAPAATPSPGWTADSIAAPTNFSPSAGGTYEVEITNAGSQPSGCTAVLIKQEQEREEKEVAEGKAPIHNLCHPGSPVVSPVVIRDEAPAGLTITGVHAPGLECTATAHVAQCVVTSVIVPQDSLRMLVNVSVDGGAAGEVTNTATVSGGGAREVSVQATNSVSSAPPVFGPANFDFFIDGLDGARDTQAGGHPYQLTTTIDLNSVFTEGKEVGRALSSVEDVKDVIVDLPLGFVGSTLAAPECTLAELSSETRCPPDTRVGTIRTEPVSLESANSAIYNLVPEHGVPAEFGYIDGAENTHVDYTHVVPTPEGYVLQFRAIEIPQIILSHIVVTFFGDPAARDSTGNAQIPFFTNPTACGGEPVTATIYMDSWQKPARLNADGTPDLGDPRWARMTSSSPPVTGCDTLQFTPELGAQPTTHAADTPSGMEFEQKLPQSESIGVPATPALKDTTVVFPAGMTVDPSSANGLGTCSEGQIGWEGPTLFDFDTAQPQCPEASKIGSLELETPLIPGVLHGEVFLAAQNANPFGSTFATYIVVNDPVTGVVLKLAGEVKANPGTGQLTAVFDETPQLPFSDLKVHFFGGPRAEFATPPSCGLFTTNSELRPWSFPGSGPAGDPFDTFQIDENCATGFNPAFTGGSTNLQAGAYTTFQASFSREDDDQELQGAEVSLPPGMLANLSSVTECGAAEIRAEESESPGGCPTSSQVGTVRSGAGPGPNPLFVGGKVFFTGPYNGGPFGLAVVVSANPGPFHFGNIVVRQSIRLNPLTAAVTDVSDPFPTFIHPVGANGQTNGIPIKLRRVDVEVNRPGFTFNPTSCAKEAFHVGGQITSVDGAAKTLATPFQVTNCATLKFAPRFSVSTSGKTSKALGASLTAKVTYPYGPQGTYANIAKVKVELPKALPSRLTTLQKACTAAQFEVDPSGCPAPSVIGHARAITPILSVPIEGPVYFVSHGGEAFPSLEMVLKGDGITIDLVGTTFISKSGITSTTFKTVPDAPVSSFEITLPEGKYSALAANGNLCSQKLAIPNEFIAQNGLAIHQSTAISVTGCKKTLTRSAKLKAALAVCHKKAKGKRATCEKAARRKYGPLKKKSKGKK